LYGVSTALFANARFLVLPHASNAVHMDCPDVVATLIGEFIHAPSAGKGHAPVRSSTLHQEMLQHVITNSRLRDHISIQLIGAFTVRVNGVVVSGNWNQRKAQPLLAYLVFHPISTRDRLCEELWIDYEFQQARNYLRVSLHHLKNLLEAAFPLQTFLHVDRQTVSLKGNIDCDVVELLYTLQNVIHTADSSLKVEAIQRITHQLQPDSLALFAHEPWFWPIRKKIESRFIMAVKWLGDEYFDQGYYVLAIEAWEHGLSFDEFDESFYQRIIHSLECLQDEAGIRLWCHRRDQAINELR
jgi:DNA-binding SARP family transcriptional activator